MLLFAHDAFYRYERRADDYDIFMAVKRPELWKERDLPDGEVSNLFRFVRHWDRFFTGKEYLFKEVYAENFDEIQRLSGKRFIEVNLEDRDVQDCMLKIFDGFATCNLTRQYEATAASKLTHAMNPDLFIMWDTKIRRAYLGSQEDKDSRDYVHNFLLLMKTELRELLYTCTSNSKISDTEAYELLEKITGNSVPKLIDQHNYMRYTMGPAFSAYISSLSEEDKENMKTPFSESIDYWKKRIPQRNHKERRKTREFNDMVNKLRELRVITAKELREYNNKWNNSPYDRDYLYENITQRLKLIQESN